MLLQEYVKSNGIKIQDFADALGTSYSYTAQLLNGFKRVGLGRARLIERLTGGKVSRMEILYPEDFTEHIECNEKI